MTFQRLDDEELTLLREGAFGSLEGENGVAAIAELGLDQFCRSPEDAGLVAALAAAEEAGRAGSTAGVHLAVAANLVALWSQGGAPAPARRLISPMPAFAQAQFGGEPAGEIRVAGGRISGTLRFVEGWPAGALLVATSAGFAVVPASETGISARPSPGLAPGLLHEIELDNAACSELALSEQQRADVFTAVRLLVAARARGAAERAFALVTEHVTTRHQFGQPLGRFQAMQHKLAECHVQLTAARALAGAAAEGFDEDAADWRPHAFAALAFGGDAVRRAMFEIQHAFGAIGYAEEHEASRHFRRVHGDLVRLGGPAQARRDLLAYLQATDGKLPEIALDARGEAYREALRATLGDILTGEILRDEATKPFAAREWNEDFASAAGNAGLIGISWPRSAGGQERSPFEQLAWLEELTRARAPFTSFSAASFLVGPEIVRHGSEKLRAQLLPDILAGKLAFALGYSEPEAGSDLASLRTRAVREGENYRITGQKLWGTGTDKATHVLLAARTGGEDKPRHKGISLFVVPLASPGITIQPDMALYGHTFSTQFYDDVVVPEYCRLGEENAGWEVLGGALAAERILMGGLVARMRFFFTDLFACIAGQSSADPVVLDRLAGFAAEIEAARRLALASIVALEQGRLPMVEGAMTKLFSGDLGERLAAFATEALGSAGTLEEGSPGVPLGGRIEQELRRSPMGVIGGGAAEVQKTIIAQRGLGLPR